MHGYAYTRISETSTLVHFSSSFNSLGLFFCKSLSLNFHFKVIEVKGIDSNPTPKTIILITGPFCCKFIP